MFRSRVCISFCMVIAPQSAPFAVVYVHLDTGRGSRYRMWAWACSCSNAFTLHSTSTYIAHVRVLCTGARVSALYICMHVAGDKISMPTSTWPVTSYRSPSSDDKSIAH